MHCACTAAGEAAPGTEAWGNTDWDTSLDSSGKLKVGIVSISYRYCPGIGTQEFIWKVLPDLSAASAGDLGVSSLSSTHIQLLHDLAFCLCMMQIISC